jgi:pimeloyl-ACP methyl ester carboxylesterase
MLLAVNPLELPRFYRGLRFSLNAMWTELSRLDLTTLVPELKMPVILLEGRRDRFVDPKLSAAFLDGLNAPLKRILWFEKSGHEPFLDESRLFNTAMAEVVLPAARAVLQARTHAAAA